MLIDFNQVTVATELDLSRCLLCNHWKHLKYINNAVKDKSIVVKDKEEW